MNWLDSITSTVSDAFNGVTDAVTDLANSGAGQKLLDLGAKYAAGQIDKETYDAQAAALQAQTDAKKVVPGWAIGLGLGSAVLLIIALVASGRRR